MNEKASVGRIVHYVLPSGEHRPGILTQVWQPDLMHHTGHGGMSNVCVFKGQSLDFHDLPGLIAHDGSSAVVGSVSYDPAGKPGTWHWPERE